ncbi:MAG: AtpZ/AtpI family protein [Dehalococcoidia bacterium]|nr:AtpZ/AtpI family protein [Dehalococcoidia bacterium]
MLNSPAFALVGIGFSLAFWIAGGALLGHWLDGRFETEPLLTLVLLVLGIMSGFYDAYRRLRELVKQTGRTRR